MSSIGVCLPLVGEIVCPCTIVQLAEKVCEGTLLGAEALPLITAACEIGGCLRAQILSMGVFFSCKQMVHSIN